MRRYIAQRPAAFLLSSFVGAPNAGLLCGWKASVSEIPPVSRQLRFVGTHFRETTTPHPLGENYKKQQPTAAGLKDSGDGTKYYHTTVKDKKPIQPPAEGEEWDNPMHHEVWTAEEVMAVERTHRNPQDFTDRLALFSIKCVRFGFDVVSGYKFGATTERKLLRRILFLETLAGIPGMVAGVLRHLRSLRLMKRDNGWIHTLLEEAENERMHMLTFMDQYRPGIVFRASVLLAQGVFWNFFFFAYLISPRFCHRFVGYLEEEAVRTYSDAVEKMDSTDPKYASLNAYAAKPANHIAIRYWKLSKDATMRDVVLAVRRDEANHRDVNHMLANIKPDELNPYVNH